MPRTLRRFLNDPEMLLGVVVMLALVLTAILGPFVWRIDPLKVDMLSSLMPPDWQHPMGTDDLGRDLLARVLQGGRISLMVGIISTIVSLIIGVSYGATAGYLGGKVDNLMMRFVDVLYSIPYILIVIVLLSVFGGPNTPDWIQFAPSLPKTRSGKIMRRILRKIAEDEFSNLGDTTTLADPAVVEDLIDNRQNRKAGA